MAQVSTYFCTFLVVCFSLLGPFGTTPHNIVISNFWQKFEEGPFLISQHQCWTSLMLMGASLCSHMVESLMPEEGRLLEDLVSHRKLNKFNYFFLSSEDHSDLTYCGLVKLFHRSCEQTAVCSNIQQTDSNNHLSK